MKILLHDNGYHLRFAPLTLTRPVGDLRMGIMTNSERWKLVVPEAEIFYHTEAYLTGKFPSSDKPDLEINATLIPDEEVVAAILNLGENDQLFYNDIWLARKGTGADHVKYTGGTPLIIEQRWHLYQMNDAALRADFNLITAGRVSQKLSPTNTVIGDPSLIFLEEGAVVEAAVLNTKTGPIYVGKDSEIMEGSVVRGPLAMCEHSALKLSSKVYGATTLGPHCKVGGEVNNAVFQAFSNKGHDGFLGNALIGEWCNLGADTNTSNLKNNYGNVSTYSYEAGEEIKTDVQFMGVCMGDHSKCGINTMFNTATVVGVSSNIYGAGFPDKYIPSFSWGGADETVPFRFEKAVEYANNMMARRGTQLSDYEISILRHIADQK
jgi:UDP-N-acetylglucosamine diphosphorylase/glucosamine-1-phosphate N-acetyltransferase